MGNRFRSVNPHSWKDIRTSRLADEFIAVAEAMKHGFSSSSPLTAMFRAIQDMLLLVISELREGVLFNPTMINIKLSQDPYDPLIFQYSDEVNKGSIGGEGKPQWYHRGTVASKREKVPNKIIKLDDPNPKLGEWLDIVLSTFRTLTLDIKADPYMYQGEANPHQSSKKLNKEQFWFFTRARKQHKRKSGRNSSDHNVVQRTKKP